MAIFPATHTKRIMRNGYVRRDAIYGGPGAGQRHVAGHVLYRNLGFCGLLDESRSVCTGRVCRKRTFQRSQLQFTLVPSAAPMPSIGSTTCQTLIGS